MSEVLQTAFSILGILGQTNSMSATGMQNGTMPPPVTTPFARQFDPLALLSMILSGSALRDWLKFIVIGSVIETCRRLLFSSWRSFLESFWITASFDDDDISYNWILFWLSKNPSWSKARRVEISTRNFGLITAAVSVFGRNMGDQAESHEMKYLPSLEETYSIWYQCHYLKVSRSQVHTQDSFRSRPRERLQVSILTRHHAVLSKILLEARDLYKAAEKHTICVYISDSMNGWRHVACRQKRPLKSIILDPGIKEMLVDDAQDFLDSKSWYSDRGIPFRRGYLLHGAPGSGKTSIIQSIAGELGMNVYMLSLSRVGLDDNSLTFHQGISRNHRKGLESGDGAEKHDSNKIDDLISSSRVTLSGLLNALDGIGAQEGRILFATTNNYSALDPALCRPGRMDVHVEFKLASKYQAEELFKCFYMPSQTEEDNHQDSDDSGKTSLTSLDHGTLIDLDPPSPSSLSYSSEKLEPLLRGHFHRVRCPVLSRSKVSQLAKQFADAIPERGLSMASLQGYLMTYKVLPYEAVSYAHTWVQNQLAEKKTA
ncbi:hypothetical protein AcV7_003195 [Taiwanofungus camphoratus]|nr:hypothetical protein AcV7_003195 [Antrodia cinnamomea]